MPNKKILDVMNEVRAAELTAIAQYSAHHYEAEALGFSGYSKEFKEESVDEMKHAEMLAERVLFLGSDPKYQLISPPKRGGDIKRKLQDDLTLERDAVKRLNSGIGVMIKEGDHGSRLLLEDILKDEERHIDQLTKELDLIKRFGDQYLALQATT